RLKTAWIDGVEQVEYLANGFDVRATDQTEYPGNAQVQLLLPVAAAAVDRRAGADILDGHLTGRWIETADRVRPRRNLCRIAGQVQIATINQCHRQGRAEEIKRRDVNTPWQLDDRAQADAMSGVGISRRSELHRRVERIVVVLDVRCIELVHAVS